jgi:hypothetical protein
MTSKLIISVFVVLTLVLSAELSFAKKICLQDGFGGFWELKGGKIDKKPYTAKYIVDSCEIPGYVTAITYSTGVQGTFVHTQTTACNVVMYQIFGDKKFNGSGTYDILANGSVDGNVTMTKVGCSSLPITTLPVKEGELKAPALKEGE